MRRIGVVLFLVSTALLTAGAAPATAGTLGMAIGGRTPSGTARRSVCGADSLSNVDTSCANDAQYFENSLAINPIDPDNVIASAIRLGPGGGTRPSLQVQPRFSYDHGRTWITSSIDYGTQPAVDPSVAFDAAGVAYLAATRNGDIVVSRSRDGGVTWDEPVVVAAASRGPGGGVFNDHPQLGAYRQGHVVVTWINDVFNAHGKLQTAPVQDATSSDQGLTWSKGTTISGAAPFCTGRQGGDACDQTFGNAIALQGDRAVVTFQETYDEAADASAALGRNIYLSVIIDAQTGIPVAGPFLVGQAYDGILEHDYPVALGIQTIHDSQFALDGMGNVAADGTRPGHFAIVWYDDRNAPHPVAHDPYRAVTDADIIVSQSFDGGREWSAPTALALPNDQVMPWAAYDGRGRLRVGFLDRSYDPANLRYGFTLASETVPGSLHFRLAEVSTALSNPTAGDSATAGTVNAAFPNPAPSIGDYTALAAGPHSIDVMWTDMRNTECVLGRCGFTQNTYFSAVPL